MSQGRSNVWKLRGILDVKDPEYGAKGDGVTADAAGFLEAETAALAAGQALHVTHGTYDVDSIDELAVTSDLVMLGEHTATIRATTADDLLRAGGGDIVLRGLAFGVWSHVVYAPQADSGYTTPLLRSEGCAASGAFDVLFHERPLSDAYIVGNTYDALTGVAIKIGFNDVTLQDNWKNFKIALNRAASIVPASAIDAYFSQIDGKYHVVALNQVDTVTANGVGEAFGYYTKMRWGLLLGNIAAAITTTGSGNPCAFQMKGAGRGDVANGVQGYSNIYGLNIGYGSGGNTERGLETHIEDALTIGNLLENFGQYCMLVGAPTAGELRGLHVGNKLIGDGGAGNYGVHENANDDDVIFIGQAIRNVDRGFNLTGDGRNRHLVGNNITDAIGIANYVSGDVALLTMVGNVVDGATRAFYFEGGVITKALIVGNNFETPTDGVQYGMRNDGAIQSGLIANNAPQRLQTTDATTTNAFNMAMRDESTVCIEATVVAVQSDGSNRATYRKEATFYRTGGGGATQEGATADIRADIESDATWGGVTITAAGNNVRVQVQGRAATTINWSVDVKAHIASTSGA